MRRGTGSSTTWVALGRATAADLPVTRRRVVGYLALTRRVGWSRHVGEIRLVVEVVAERESTIGLFTRPGFRVEAPLVDQVRDPNAHDSVLPALAHRPAEGWRPLETVGLDEPLDRLDETTAAGCLQGRCSRSSCRDPPSGRADPPGAGGHPTVRRRRPNGVRARRRPRSRAGARRR